MLLNCIILTIIGYNHQSRMLKRNPIYKGDGLDEKLGKYSYIIKKLLYKLISEDS